MNVTHFAEYLYVISTVTEVSTLSNIYLVLSPHYTLKKTHKYT